MVLWVRMRCHLKLKVIVTQFLMLSVCFVFQQSIFAWNNYVEAYKRNISTHLSWNQTSTFIKIHLPLFWIQIAAMFFNQSIWLDQIFCRGSTKEHSMKLFQIQRRRILEIGRFYRFLMPQQPKFLVQFKSLYSFERVAPKDHTNEVWLKLVQWFRRIHFF